MKRPAAAVQSGLRCGRYQGAKCSINRKRDSSTVTEAALAATVQAGVVIQLKLGSESTAPSKPTVNTECSSCRCLFVATATNNPRRLRRLIVALCNVLGSMACVAGLLKIRRSASQQC